MKIAITGNTKGLGKALSDKLSTQHEIIGFNRSSIPIEKYNEIIQKSLNADVFINNAYSSFYQTTLLQLMFNEWQDKEKTIINIISRSKYPNISKGFMYSASKASLSHLASSLRFKTSKKCRIIDINPGLLDSKIDSLSYEEAADIIIWCINQPMHIEIGEISFWHTSAYVDIQKQKEKLKLKKF